MNATSGDKPRPLATSSTVPRASAVPWWSAADGAELDCLVFELSRAYFEHRESCPACQRRDPCPQLAKAIETIVEWRDARELLSRAEWLRAERDALEAAA